MSSESKLETGDSREQENHHQLQQLQQQEPLHSAAHPPSAPQHQHQLPPPPNSQHQHQHHQQQQQQQSPYQKNDDAHAQHSTPTQQQYGHVNQIPIIVSHYPPGGSFQPFSYQQQVAYAQAQFYQQASSHQQIPLPMTPSSAPPMSQPLAHLPPQQQQGQHQHQQPLPPQQQSQSNSPSSEFHTPQRNMPAPRIPGSASSATNSRKHSTPAGTPESQRKKPRRSDHSTPGDEGDQELKSLAHKALDIPLEDIAAEVRALEAIPSSASSAESTSTKSSASKPSKFKPDNNKERQKQVFAMSWLLRACDTSSTAVVPRNRIYARYVGICADNGLKPLSPASFGKLVRLLYPSLTTRRLGMRGQSKYHYCGLKLIGDEETAMTPITSSGNTPLHNPSFDSSFLPGSPYGSNSPASFNSQVSTPLLSNSNSNTNTNNLAVSTFLSNHLAPDLKFVPELLDLIEQSAEASKPLILPEIRPYLPLSTDVDVADTLYGLYKAHCTSIFEALRYMQLKKLFSLLASFHSSLTAPVLRLYSSPQILPWIITCDTVMYKGIIKMLAKLALQDIPPTVLQQLKQVSQTYTEKVSGSLGSMPVKLVLGKLRLAKQFAQLISRLVRVAETAQTANKVLSNELDRDLMYNDWVKFVNIEQIASKELPCDGENYKKAVNILSEKIPEFLKREVKDDDSIINEWGNYISILPGQFVDVPPRLFLLCTSAILTSALREISLAGGAGFGAWWVLRCWVDEWIGWCAELGGFISTLEEETPLLPDAAQSSTNSNGKSKGSNGKKAKDHTPIEQDHGEEVEEDLADGGSEEPVDLLDGQFGSFLTASNGRHGEGSKRS